MTDPFAQSQAPYATRALLAEAIKALGQRRDKP